ncbi:MULTISPECIES: DUF1132 family protein [Neisseria]|uniref:DUF1132 family protein n=1 Tax=Neisseria TaxID=482 RepID=UPI0005A873FF|nr:DUF1132 family protein [Neisseria viridiae]
MFITEAQLALYKYQAASRYFNQPMSLIARNEFIEFGKVSKSAVNVIECFSHFWNRKIDNDIWEFSFPDGSTILIKRVKEKDEEKYYFQCASDSVDCSGLFPD